MNAVELIERDHREVEQLFREWEQGDPGARRDVVQTIIRELSVHAAIEEQVLYPAMRRLLPDGERLMQEAIQEHQEAKEVLSDLEAKGPEDPGFTQKVGALIQDVRHHVEEEERELLPSLASAMSDQELDELGERLEIARRAAPTRPHPHAPSTPPRNIAAGAAAAVVDRARDALTGRGTEPTPRKAAGRKAAGGSRARKAGAKQFAGRASSRRAAATRGRRTSRGPVYHVTPAPDGGWRAEKAGSNRAVARGDNKREVVRKARDRAKAQDGRLVIHKQNGRIQEERTYGPRRKRG